MPSNIGQCGTAKYHLKDKWPPFVRRPRSAHGDILNRAARNVAHNLSEQKTSKIRQSQTNI